MSQLLCKLYAVALLKLMEGKREREKELGMA